MARFNPDFADPPLGTYWPGFAWSATGLARRVMVRTGSCSSTTRALFCANRCAILTQVLAPAALASPYFAQRVPGLVAVSRTLGGTRKFALQPHSAPLLGRCDQHLVQQVSGAGGYRQRDPAIHPHRGAGPGVHLGCGVAVIDQERHEPVVAFSGQCG